MISGIHYKKYSLVSPNQTAENTLEVSEKEFEIHVEIRDLSPMWL
jgi:hypothetical protein